MSYTITTSDDNRYIILKASGLMSRMVATNCYREALAKGVELGLRRYLVDFTECTNTDTILRSYRFPTKNTDESKKDTMSYTALLAKPNDHAYDFMKMTLSTPDNEISIFNDMKQALWYLQTN